MKNKFFSLTASEKKEITEIVKAILGKRSDIVFAYLHGSFITDARFRDIDVAVYLSDLPSSPLQMELELENELGSAVRKYPIDVRMLNNAPLSFRYQVIKTGLAIVVRNDDGRCDFVEATFSNYFDFAPFRKRYLKEALGSGI